MTKPTKEQRSEFERRKEELKKIFIRARVNSKWGSYSLQELIDKGYGGQIAIWFLDRFNIHEGEVITEETVVLMVAILEAIGQVVCKLK